MPPSRVRALAFLAGASLLATACGGAVDSPTPQPSPPVIATFSASPSSVAPGGSSTLSWSVSGSTTLSIDNGLGTVTGTSRAVTPAATTTYTLTATNAGGSSTATATVTVSAVAPPVIASFSANPASVAPGGSSTLSWSVTGATTLSIDNGVGTVTGTSRAVTPAATTTYTLTATNAGGSRTATATVTVGGTPSPLEVACSGIGCGASGPATYSGSGVGLWRRTNPGPASETVSFTLDGVTAGKSVVLLFSNGAEGATTLPNGGVASDPPLAAAALAMPPAPPVEGDPVQEAADRADLWMIARNRVEAAIARDLAASPAASLAAPAAPLPTPAVGDTRTWWNNFDPTTPVQYTAVAKRVCALPGGRNGILWVDPNATAAGNVTEADLDYFQATFCGTSGGYARIVALRGEPWGTTDVVALNPDVFIQDTPAPQDVHVVFLNVPSSTTWGGYFYGFNNFLRTYGSRYATSNEALAFFINAPGVRINRGYYASTLLHEATHMVNYYQRSIVKGAGYDTWLEEMSAMMTEDFITPAVTPDATQKIPVHRIWPYLKQGGAVNLTDWTGSTPTANPYNGVGSLGAFLNRRYGLSIYQGMVNCPKLASGVGCVNSLVVAAGGTGFADDLARMGASVYALLPQTGQPAGYGFPQVTWNGYTFGAVNLLAWAADRPAVAASLGTGFTAATHWYVLDTVAAGRTSYTRTSLVLPAGVTLLVVVQ